MLIRSLLHLDHARDLLEPLERGWASKADLHLVLVDVFERRNVIDLDQPPCADDCDAVAGVLDLRKDVRGEEDRPSLGAPLSDHAIEFLLVEWVQAAGGFVQDEHAWLMHK